MKNTIQIKNFLGNVELLTLKKTAFLCSRKISASSVLKCYDWAILQRDNGNCVISGFHSRIEKDVFHYLAKGKQPIILALPRGIKSKWEPEIEELLKSNRFLIITPFDLSVTRVTNETAKTRNHLMIDLADDIVIGYKSKVSQLNELITSYQTQKKIEYLTE
jgi:hypothetical protein